LKKIRSIPTYVNYLLYKMEIPDELCNSHIICEIFVYIFIFVFLIITIKCIYRHIGMALCKCLNKESNNNRSEYEQIV